MEKTASRNSEWIHPRPGRSLWRWTGLWTVLWTLLYCGEVTAVVDGCPSVSGGRVVCLQSQLCAPGRPLPGPGCGPRFSHVCCLKGRAAAGTPSVPAPAPPSPWKPAQHQPWSPGQLKPWKPPSNSPGQWPSNQPNAVIPDPPSSWQWDQPSHVFPKPPPLPTPPPLPSPVPPSVVPARPSVGPTIEPLLQCGREQPSVGRRRRAPSGLLGVTGGQDAVRQRWPWAALLGERGTSGDQRWFCGAVLVGRRALVTAAHCVVGRQPAQLLVRLGEYDLSTTADGRTQDLAASELLVHPGYAARPGQPHSPLHDLAIIRLRRPALLGPHVQPVCLPAAGQPAGALTGQPVSLAGWGLTEFAGSRSDVLQEAELRVVAPESCEAAYRQLPTFGTEFPAGLTDSVLCATGGGGGGGELARDACRGDSGGPLVRRLADGSYQLVGIVSAGVGCGNPEFPGLYTRISAHIDWILQNI
ncbi:clotting factor G beta subunit-like [Amphibalanus amphitrite]|uniref:clotting factor G beta subunit-like n=1 Tax=Amphibalanus amphitrite TaxID=1232801 RepID=UPI001C91E0FD|nr:clotting factor G beta subunit-like [Amphibalanus amphitrite]